MIALIDYGAGNIGSIMNMLKRLAIPAVRASTPAQLEAARGIILPGVGAFDYCMSSFNKSGMREAVEKLALEGDTPLLGICVGLQMMFAASEEGREPGLNWLKGKVVRFDASRMPNSLKIPHMGWSFVTPRPHFTPLQGIERPRFYFVHSYHAVCDDEADIAATAQYGYDFTCGVARKNIYGAQFHPEKSHKYGMAVLRNFARMCGVS